MPLWVAVAIVAAAFALRALLRGPSFDSGDALVLALFVVVLAITAGVRAWIARHENEPSGIERANRDDREADNGKSG